MFFIAGDDLHDSGQHSQQKSEACKQQPRFSRDVDAGQHLDAPGESAVKIRE